MRQVYIYALCEPDQPWNIRYVGKTIDPLRKRLSEHLETNRLKPNTHKNAWIKSLIRLGKIPDIKLLDVGTDRDWESLEKFYISSYQLAGFNLTNATEGGDGLHSPSVEIRNKISASVSKSLIGNTRSLGRKDTEDTKRKKSIAQKTIGNKPPSNKGKKHSLETIEKIKETNKKTWARKVLEV